MGQNGILFFQRSQLDNSIHPFVLSEVDAFCKKYDKVYLICFGYSCKGEELQAYSNLTIKTISLKKARHNFFATRRLFSRTGIKDIIIAIKNHLSFRMYLKNTMQVLMFGDALAKKAAEIIAKDSTDTWFVEGYWFSGPAYAAACLKKRFGSRIKAVTRAHSSEIDIKRNPAAICMMKGFILQWIDKICFISDWGKKSFEEDIFPHYGWMNMDKCVVCRLGVRKNNDQRNTALDDGTFRLLTCSRAVRLKRLPLLATALKLAQIPKKIEWTHIGEGEDLAIVASLMKNCEGIVFIEKGSLPNAQVLTFLADNPVDLFVNVSEYEGLPVSIIEAFSFGIPALATDAGGTAEIVTAQNGMLIPVASDAEEIAKALNMMFERLTRSSKQIRDSAFETWKTKYDKEKNYDEFFFLMNGIG